MDFASRSVLSINPLAPACAKGPPEPIAIRSSSGCITSPLPVIIRDASLFATASRASNFLKIRSDLQSFASSTAARVKLPSCCSSLISNRSKSVKASAVPPAKPAMTSSL